MTNENSCKVFYVYYNYLNLKLKFYLFEMIQNIFLPIIKNKIGSFFVLMIIEDFIKISKKVEENNFFFLYQIQVIGRHPNEAIQEKNKVHRIIIKSFYEIITDINGCNFLISYYQLNNNHFQKAEIFETSLKNARFLLKQFPSNFLFNFLISMNQKKFNKKLLDYISKSPIEYCNNEISSGIILNLLDFNYDFRILIREIVNQGFNQIFSNIYGNKSKFILFFNFSYFQTSQM